MARISLVVCDVCSATTKATVKWTIIAPDGTRKTLDLCKDDEGPIKKLVGTTSDTSAPAEGAKRGRRQITVTPIEELVK